MMRSRVVSLIIPITLIMLNHLPALAETGAAPDREVARQHFGRGVVLYEGGNYSLALEQFQAAYEAMPHPSVLINIANCYGRTDRPVLAVRTFERYLRERGSRLSSAERAQVEGAMAEQRARVGTVRVQVPGLTGGTVTLDGLPLGTAPLEHREETIIGPHVVAVRLAGRDTIRVTGQVRGGQTTTIFVPDDAPARQPSTVSSPQITADEEAETVEPEPPQSSTLAVVGTEGATVEIDGERRGKTPWEGPVVGGSLALRLTGPGLVSWSGVVEVAGQGRTDVTIDLTPQPNPGWVRPLEWSLLGVGVALAAAGGVALGVGWSRYKDSEAMYAEIDQGNFADIGEQDQMWARYGVMYDECRRNWGIGWGLAIGGGAMLLTSLIIFLVDRVGKLFAPRPEPRINHSPIPGEGTPEAAPAAQPAG